MSQNKNKSDENYMKSTGNKSKNIDPEINVTLSSDEENEDDIDNVDPLILKNTFVQDMDWTVETLFNQINRKNIEMSPVFQRRDAWGIERKAKFIESLILGLPIPQIVLAEDNNNPGKFIVIDGKQRLSAIASYMGFEEEGFQIEGLKILKELNGLKYNDFSQRNNFRDQLDNTTIRTTVVRNWKDDRALYLIFYRLNSGTLPLSAQELRHVLHRGKFIDFVFEFSGKSQAMINIFGQKNKPDFRMRDTEMFIRFFGFRYYIAEYNGDLKQFLDSTTKKLNMDFESNKSDAKNVKNDAFLLEKAINLTNEIFGKNAFSKFSKNKFEGRFNRAVFDVMVYYFSDQEIIDYISTNTKNQDIIESYKKLSEKSQDFMNSLEVTTKSVRSTATRLFLWGNTLQDIIPFNILRLGNVKKKYISIKN